MVVAHSNFYAVLTNILFKFCQFLRFMPFLFLKHFLNIYNYSMSMIVVYWGMYMYVCVSEMNMTEQAQGIS